MNIKKIAIAINLLISSNLVMGAIYDLQDEQQSLSSNSGLATTLKKELDNSFSSMKLSGQQIRSPNIKQDYLNVLTLLKNNQLENAEKKIDTLIKQYPKEAEFYNLLALSKTLLKNYSLAIKGYQKAIELSPNNLTAHIGLAKLYLQTNDLTQAKKHTNITLSINDKLVRAYFLLATIADKENNQQEIETILLTALKKTQGNIKQEIAVANKLAKFYAVTEQPSKTLTLANSIIKRYPDHISALSFLASAQILNGKNTQAIQTLTKLTSQDKKDTKHRLLLVSLLINQPEKEQQIIKLMDEATSISPNNLQILTQKAVFLTEMQHYEAAALSINKIKKLAPETGLAELLKGNLYLAEKKIHQALTAYQKSYKIKPNPKALNQITNIMIAQGKQSDAINFLIKELNRNPKNLTAHLRLANIYEKLEKMSKAEKHYLAILSEQPDNALILNNLAWLYHQQNNPEALLLAEKAYQKAPNSAAVADTYGTILVNQGNLKKGIQVLEKASKLDPAAYNIQYHLANAYDLNGNHKQAKKILKTIVKPELNFSEKNAALSLSNKLE